MARVVGALVTSDESKEALKLVQHVAQLSAERDEAKLQYDTANERLRAVTASLRDAQAQLRALVDTIAPPPPEPQRVPAPGRRQA